MPDDTPLITAYLADRHVPCPACGYDLHGVTSSQCPECGEAIVLHLGQRSSRRATRAIKLAGAALTMAALVYFATETYAHIHTRYMMRFAVVPRWSLYTLVMYGCTIAQFAVGIWILLPARRARDGQPSARLMTTAVVVLVSWICVLLSVRAFFDIRSLWRL